MLGLRSWCSLEIVISYFRYDPNGSQKGLKASDLLQDLNETVMNAWNLEDTKHVLSELQGMLYSNYFSVLSSKRSTHITRELFRKNLLLRNNLHIWKKRNQMSFSVNPF